MFKQWLAALSVALALACPAYAQTQVVQYSGTANVTSTGALVTSGDVVVIQVSGAQWATVKWTVIGTAGTAAITTEVSLDGGVNWLPSAYSKRLDAVSANPSVSVWSNNGAVSGSSWETPLPGNATMFQVRCATSGTSTTIRVVGGTPYVPGVPVTAVLYDVTEASIGAGVTAYVQDTSGWASVTTMASSPTGQVWSVRQLYDDGTNISGVAATFTAAAGGTATFTRYGGNTTSGTVGASAQALYANLTRRMAWSLPAAGTVATGRMRVEAAR